jgi:hypothetical protein
MTISKLIRLTAVTLALTASAAASFSAGAGSALAPEPAKLNAALAPTAGATAAAVYVNTSTPTSVRFYSGSWTNDSYGPAAGTPCSNTSLATDQLARQVIQTMGTWRRCI